MDEDILKAKNTGEDPWNSDEEKHALGLNYSRLVECNPNRVKDSMYEFVSNRCRNSVRPGQRTVPLEYFFEALHLGLRLVKKDIRWGNYTFYYDLVI